jgi:DNA gyrase subunit A
MLITDGGTLIRTAANGISVLGRNTQGVKLISLDEQEKLVGLERIEEPELNGDEEGEVGDETDEAPSSPQPDA